MTQPFFPFIATARRASRLPPNPRGPLGAPQPSISSEPSTEMPPPTVYTGYARMQRGEPKINQNGRNTNMGTLSQINLPPTLPHPAPPAAFLLTPLQPHKHYNIFSSMKNGLSSMRRVFRTFKAPCERCKSHVGSNTSPPGMPPDNSKLTLSNGARLVCARQHRFTSPTNCLTPNVHGLPS